MSCISWNVRGLGNSRIFNGLSNFVLSVKPSFIFLMKSRLDGSELNCLFQKFHYHSFHCVEADDKTGGLILGWLKSLEMYIISSLLHHVSFRVCHMSGIGE